MLLIGEPAAGKTTIASLLAMAALDQWGASTLKLDEPGKVIQHWNPDEPTQFFWVDDAFGVMQYESGLVHGWNHVLPQIRTMLRKGAKIVMTSRDYIYNRARKDLKEGAFPLLRESQVVIDVHDLTGEERRQILYNHLKLGQQPATFRTEVKPHLEDIAVHERFVPETARRLADPVFTKGLWIDRYYLLEFVDKREQFLQEVLQGLDAHSRAALALIYMRNGRLGSPIALEPSEGAALERLGSSLGQCIDALDALNGSLVQRVDSDGDFIWQFKHPTIGDAYALALAQHPELLGIYVQGTGVEELIAQVTCGDVGLERAVVIPRGLFPLVLKRLGELSSSSQYKTAWMSCWGARRNLQNFLAFRCSKDFLALCIEQNPAILESVAKPGLMLYAVPEVDLAIKLHDVGLLPEPTRARFVAAVCEYALDGEDFYAFESERVRRVFTEDEFAELLRRAREDMLPRLAGLRRQWQNNHQSDDSPDDHIQPFLDGLGKLKAYFEDDDAAVATIAEESRSAVQWAAEHQPDDEDDKPDRRLGETPSAERATGGRSIFDDVDA